VDLKYTGEQDKNAFYLVWHEKQQRVLLQTVLNKRVPENEGISSPELLEKDSAGLS